MLRGAHRLRKLPVHVFQQTANCDADVQSSTSRMRVLLCLSHLAAPSVFQRKVRLLKVSHER